MPKKTAVEENHLIKAGAMLKLMREGCDQTEACRKLGISEGRGSQLLRLSELPEPIKASYRAGKISFSHCRILIYNVRPDFLLEVFAFAEKLYFKDFVRFVDTVQPLLPQLSGVDGFKRGDVVQYLKQECIVTAIPSSIGERGVIELAIPDERNHKKMSCYKVPVALVSKIKKRVVR